MERWTVNRDQCVYTSCYCEENIWKLCETWKQNDPEHFDFLYAVFISNERQQIPIWEQKSASNHEHPVIWDYHVILIDKSASPSIVYDFDTTLPFPVSSSDYIRLSIRDELQMPHKFHRMFRVISAKKYLSLFASDRSHMLKEDKVTYNAPPPLYPPICNEKSKNNINEFIDMKSKNGPGIVMNLPNFCQFLDVHN